VERQPVRHLDRDLGCAETESQLGGAARGAHPDHGRVAALGSVVDAELRRPQHRAHPGGAAAAVVPDLEASERAHRLRIARGLGRDHDDVAEELRDLGVDRGVEDLRGLTRLHGTFTD